MAEDNTDDNKTRAAATVVLHRMQAAHANIERAGSYPPGSAAQSQLAAAISKLVAAEVQLAQAADSPASHIQGTDLAAFEQLMQGVEAEARQAEVTGAAEAAGRALETEAARQRETEAIGNDLFQRHIFDPYLHFDSDKDKEEYEKDRARRAQELAAAQALHTPEGDRKAYQILREQLESDGAHGADASPDFKREMGRLEALEAYDRKGQQTGVRSANGVPPASVTDGAKPRTATGEAATDQSVAAEAAAALAASGVALGPDAPPPTGHGLASQERPAQDKTNSPS
jgi:hypothetical protein